MFRSFLTLSWLVLCASAAPAVPWPKDYLVLDDTKSPGDRYGVIVPPVETAPEEEEQNTNYLANLKTHQVLGKIENAHYAIHRNHYSLSAKWSPDNTFAVIEYDWRFGFHAVTLVEIKSDGLSQVDLTPHILKATPNASACTLFLRIGTDRKIRFRVVSTSDPKQMSPETNVYGLFQGTYDVVGRKWTVEDGRKLSFEQYELLSNVYDDASHENTGHLSEESEASSLDRQLNDAYQALRLLLPPAKFARLKTEQVAWVKKLENGRPTDAERIAALRPRVRELRDLVW